jgi:hypothetical protein
MEHNAKDSALESLSKDQLITILEVMSTSLAVFRHDIKGKFTPIFNWTIVLRDGRLLPYTSKRCA